jgi:hypothetical protein
MSQKYRPPGGINQPDPLTQHLRLDASKRLNKVGRPPTFYGTRYGFNVTADDKVDSTETSQISTCLRYVSKASASISHSPPLNLDGYPNALIEIWRHLFAIDRTPTTAVPACFYFRISLGHLHSLFGGYPEPWAACAIDLVAQRALPPHHAGLADLPPRWPTANSRLIQD